MTTASNPPTTKPRRSGIRLWAIRIGMLVLGPLLLLLAIELVWHGIGDPRFATQEQSLAKLPPHFRLGQLGMLQVDPDPAVSYSLRPGFRAEVGGNLYRINNLGMRGGPVTVARPAGMRRVLVLGDSYAFGFGVGEADTISAQLEEQLAGDSPGVQVLNMGVPGYHTGQEEAVLVRDGLPLDPDLVVLVYFANDNITQTFLYDPRLKGPYVDELPLSLEWKRRLNWSILYGKVAKAYERYLTDRGELDSIGPRHWPVTRDRLARIADLLAAKKIPFLLVTIPALANSTTFIDTGHAYNTDHDRLLAFAAAKGIAVADLRAELLRRFQPIENLFVSRDPEDSHLNREGYGIVVDLILEQIRNRRMLR